MHAANSSLLRCCFGSGRLRQMRFQQLRSGSTSPSADGANSSDGGSGGGGQPDAGQPDAGGGGGQPDGGGGGGGQPDAGGGQDECAGLGLDAVAQPNGSAALFAGRYDTCLVGSTDGSGTVALIMENRFNGPPEAFTVHLLDSSGAERGSYVGYGTVLVEELAGFELRNWDLQQGELAAIDGKGSTVGTTGRVSEYFWLIVNDPLGGIVVASVPSGSTSPNVVAAYDERVKLRWRTQLSSTEEVLALGVDRQGNTLVLLDSAARYGTGTLGGIWVDHAGNAGAEFEAADGLSSPRAVTLTARVGNGLFLQGGGAGSGWIRQFDPMGQGSAPPDWLAARPATKLHMARNGRAYAVIHPARLDAACHADIEVVAPSGKSCGTAVFPADLNGPYCAGALTVGYDGTIIDLVGDKFVGDGTSSRYCNFHWWTGFLH